MPCQNSIYVVFPAKSDISNSKKVGLVNSQVGDK
jgi:hypothetical protein